MIPYIVCTCDESYLPLLKVFINSLNKNSKIDYNLCVRLIDVDFDPSFLSGSYIIHDHKNLDTKRNKLINEGMLLHDFVSEKEVRRNKDSLYRGARWLYSDKMAYCANIKFNTINHLLDKGYDVFYFDVDTIVRKSIECLFKLLNSHELLIKKTPSHPDKPFSEPYDYLYHTGMIGVKNCNNTRSFFKLIEQRCLAADFYNWDTDQIEFANLVERDKYNINIYNIEDKYKDEQYNPNSNIWCGAAAGKVSNLSYIEEMSRYE